MPLCAGDKLGPYEILAPLGAGGMGEVIVPGIPNSIAKWRDSDRLARLERDGRCAMPFEPPGSFESSPAAARSWSSLLSGEVGGAVEFP